MKLKRAFWIASLIASGKMVLSVALGLWVSEQLMVGTLALGEMIEWLLERIWPAIGDDRANLFLATLVCDWVAIWLLAFLILRFRRPANGDGAPNEGVDVDQV